MIFQRRRKRRRLNATNFSAQLVANPTRFNWWQRLLLIAIPILLIAIIWTLFWSGIFTVNKVEISGNEILSAEQIKTHLNITGQNILTLNTTTSEESLTQLPEVKQAVLIRLLPHTIRVIVQERKSVLVWETTNQLWSIDQLGIPFQIVTAVPDGLFKVVDTANVHVDLGVQAVPTTFINSYQEIVPALQDVYSDGLDHFEIGETIYDLDSITKDGHRVRLNILSNVLKQLAELKRIQEQRPDLFSHNVIDLRVDRWAYIQ